MVPSMVNNGRCLSTKVNEKGKNQADSICLKYSGQDGVESKTIGHGQAEEMKQQKQGIFGESCSPMRGADGYNAVDKISKIQVHMQFLQCVTLIQDKVDPVYLQELIGLHVSLLKENDNDEAKVDHTEVTTKQQESESGRQEEEETTVEDDEEAAAEDDETTAESSETAEENVSEKGDKKEGSDEQTIKAEFENENEALKMIVVERENTTSSQELVVEAVEAVEFNNKVQNDETTSIVEDPNTGEDQVDCQVAHEADQAVVTEVDKEVVLAQMLHDVEKMQVIVEASNKRWKKMQKEHEEHNKKWKHLWE